METYATVSKCLTIDYLGDWKMIDWIKSLIIFAFYIGYRPFQPLSYLHRHPKIHIGQALVCNDLSGWKGLYSTAVALTINILFNSFKPMM